MGTTSEKLAYLQETKEAIKDAIVNKGVEVTEDTTFREYATKIGEIGGSVIIKELNCSEEPTKSSVIYENFLDETDEANIIPDNVHILIKQLSHGSGLYLPNPGNISFDFSVSGRDLTIGTISSISGADINLRATKIIKLIIK